VDGNNKNNVEKHHFCKGLQFIDRNIQKQDVFSLSKINKISAAMYRRCLLINPVSAKIEDSA
jgi:hypothetical protein